MNDKKHTAAEVGNIREHNGKLFVEVPKEQWDKIESAVLMDQDLVAPQVVMKELGIGKKRLANLISCGRITRKMYTIAVNGAKFFYNKMILGIRR